MDSHERSLGPYDMVERSMSTFGEDVAAGIELAAAGDGKRLSAAKRAQIIVALKANSNAAEVAKQIGDVTHVSVWKIAKARVSSLPEVRPREITALSRPSRNQTG